MEFIVVYVTHENKEEAEKIAKQLLEKKLIACYNIFPITSGYWWKGNIANSDEYVSLLKTQSENWEKVKQEVESMHPYETPCIMKLDAEANDSYAEWIYEECE